MTPDHEPLVERVLAKCAEPIAGGVEQVVKVTFVLLVVELATIFA